MAISLVQMWPHTAGSKIAYRVNEDSTSLQLTVGGRTTGAITIKYRPDLPLKEEVEQSDLEIPEDHTINFAADGQGVLRRTIIIPSIKLSHIEISDIGNDALPDFWLHISQWGQGL